MIVVSTDEMPTMNEQAVTGWVVIFHSSDPSNWNTAIGTSPEENPFAIKLVNAPNLYRFVRLTRTDSDDFVILPMSEHRLQSRSVIGRYGWNGTGEFAWAGYHLGIYDTESVSTSRGFAAIAPTDPFVAQASYHGWGFGNNNLVDDRQMYSWNLNPIDKTTFEIAVTARDLTEEERKHLLE